MERPREEEPETVREGIGALVTKLLAASREHNAEECAALFTEDGSILSPYGVEVRGQKAIEATHKEWFDQGEANKRLELLECDAGGDVGYCILAYAGDYPQPDGSYTTESGKSVNVLRQQPNGEWRIHVSSLNSDKPSLA
jgi:uncharacterized protein (TIGR02246 family)